MFESVHCPNCNALIKIDPKLETFFCNYCGSQIVKRQSLDKVHIELSGQVGLIGRPTADTLTEYGYSLLSLNLKEASVSFKKALEINPQSSKAWRGLAEVFLYTPFNCDDLSSHEIIDDGCFVMKDYQYIDLTSDVIRSIYKPYWSVETITFGPNSFDLVHFNNRTQHSYIANFKTFCVQLQGINISIDVDKVAQGFPAYHTFEDEEIEKLYRKIELFLSPLSHYINNTLKYTDSKSEITTINNYNERFVKLPLQLILNLSVEAKKRPKESCYIATAVYGSYDAPQVLVLRKFRNDKLSHSTIGRLLIRSYYLFGSSFSKIIAKSPILNNVARKILDRFVAFLSKN